MTTQQAIEAILSHITAAITHRAEATMARDGMDPDEIEALMDLQRQLLDEDWQAATAEQILAGLGDATFH
jgi:flagellar motor component MotA